MFFFLTKCCNVANKFVFTTKQMACYPFIYKKIYKPFMKEWKKKNIRPYDQLLEIRGLPNDDK